MGNSKDNVRKKAEAFFIENVEVTQTEIAELYNVSFQTVNTWTKKYDWEGQRLTFHASPTKIKQLLQKELLNIATGGEPTINAPDVSKLMSALDKCEKTADPIVVQKILKDLDLFISQIDSKLAPQYTPYHKQFLQHRIALENSK
ncbi:helix-turn-helix domain containing protein [Flavobacterium psychrophilum]|uniref:helix-turn-helix domain containing protein n=1 Tax=Flavobacterium psychrophilum TaxID=96345 RepID=UPI000B7C18F5|nr:helix-turn-helix domain containing protein [Flavobacterium psychrophilum]MCB6062529.1 helix-turn-helix domain containing protein [Flavobacterium psychrophilum]MEB3378389.1 helix-turn-helix domain containing protein [Flavobacterium psychrophilum]SNA88293.1 conserved hypothetical protein [Flavobacterium psychrophilum]